MIGSAIKVACALTRLDTCALVFISVLLPTYYRTQDLRFSLTHAIPILTICMCGFVINDLSDIEKDKENHPNRPLPSNRISEIGASVIYFTLLTISLTTIKLYIDLPHVYLYLLLLVALINYNYVVSYFPTVKNFYVAVAGLIPIFILSSLIQNEMSAVVIAPALFMFLLGREMLMDVEDSKGDAWTLVNTIGAPKAENLAIAVKLLGSLWLCLFIRNFRDAAIVLSLVFLDLFFVVLWKRNRYRKAIIHSMKFQLLIGIYYLIT